MTARGKQVKLQTLSFESEIYVYNRLILSAKAQSSISSLLPTTPEPDHYRLDTPPDGPRNKDNLETWRKLFSDRKAWAKKLEDRYTQIVEEIKRLDSQATIIQRSAAIAVENVKQHIANLRPKFEDARIWADNVLHDQSSLLEAWESTVNKYPSIPAIKALGLCLSGPPLISQEANNSLESETSLHDFIDIEELTRAGNISKSSNQRFKHRATEINVAFSDVEQKAESIVENFNRDANLSNSVTVEQEDHLLEEIQVMTKKITADHDHVLGLSQAPNAIAQVTRIALLHTRSFIPTLLQTADELNQLWTRTVNRKNEAQTSGVQYLQNISTVESRIALVHAKLAKLDIDLNEGQAFDVLGSAIRLPSTYGLLLVECVRRLEWTEKITADSSTLVEEMATFREEEAKRRRKWLKDMDGAVDLGPINDMSVSIDIDVKAEKQHWPGITREVVHGYTATLRELHGFDGAVKEIDTACSTLDAPTKQQSRRANAFKNGSIHDTAFGRNSLLLRGDGDILLALKGEKSKLEDKLKSSESRIRKLEDLLHRQSQMSRPSSSNGNPFSVQTPRGASPVIGFTPSQARPASRRSSTSSRRISMHNESDEKSLGKRIVSLEAELLAEKAQSAGLQKDAAARLGAEDSLKAQVREAVSVKEDLLGNFEAQQKEFEDERRLLEDENLKLKIRLEEAEDELDHVVDVRDHEARALAAEEEIQKVREEAAQDVRAAHERIALFRKDLETLQDTDKRLQQQNTDLMAKADQKSAELQGWETAEAKYRKSLQSVLHNLGHETAEAGDLGDVIQAVGDAAQKYKSDFEKSKQSLENVRKDNDGLLASVRRKEAEVENVQEQLSVEKTQVLSVKESLAQNSEELKRLKMDLDKERKDHDQLKNIHQATESHADSLQNKVVVTKHELDTLRGSVREYRERLEKRAGRAEIISQRLFTQISLLEKLLQQVGYVVSRQKGNPMTVQKIPKAPGTSTMLSSSGPLPNKPSSESSSFPDYLSWATSDDPETEANLYSLFDENVASFDVNVFHEAVIKRIKDAEHLARKWQREARGYRDKFHRVQNEAHDKIAFRSFKEGDLALFLPTRNQATRPWAAFNVGAPHYFLRELDSHKLRSRDWLLARISKVEERIVDLSKSINGINGASDRLSLDASNGASMEDENPFELSDGLRWYLLDAAEEKPGAPISVGLGKATVASASVDARGSSIRPSRKSDGKDGATKTLTRSLDSRRSSTNSKNQAAVAASSQVQAGGTTGASVTGEEGLQDGTKPDEPTGNNGFRNTDEGRSNPGHPVQEHDATYRNDRNMSPTKSSEGDRGTSGRSVSRPSSTSPQKPSPQKGTGRDRARARGWNSLWSLDYSSETGKQAK
ncbi:MAG: hypothetical protein Q9219_001888 [cf. Caloplaca sp. 3 TL-2023]